MTVIVLVDMRENNGHIVALVDENDNIAQFDKFEDAVDAIKEHPLSVFPILYVNMDE